MEKAKIGDTIKIIKMDGEPQYTNREGVVTHIDDAGQIHGTWGGCAVIPEVDTYIIVKRAWPSRSSSFLPFKLIYHCNGQFRAE